MDKDPDYVFKFPDPEDQVSAPIISFNDVSFNYPGVEGGPARVDGRTGRGEREEGARSVPPSSASMMCHSITPHLPHPPHLQLGSDPLFHRTFDIKPCTSFPHAPLLVFRRPHTLPQPQLRSRSGEPLCHCGAKRHRQVGAVCSLRCSN